MEIYENSEKEIFRSAIFNDTIISDDYKIGVSKTFANMIEIDIRDKKGFDSSVEFLKRKLQFQPKTTKEELKGSNEFLEFLKGQEIEGMLEYIIYIAISFYTFGNSRVLGLLKYIEQIKSIEINDDDDSVKIVLQNGKVIQFSRLSQYLNDYASIEPSIKKELESHKRMGKCHPGSIVVSDLLEDKNDLVSGVVHFFDDKFLHSCVETTIMGKTMVADYTWNALINKDGYEYLTKFEEKNRISSQHIKDDIKNRNFEKLDQLGIDTKAYAFFRDEILANIDRAFKGEDR